MLSASPPKTPPRPLPAHITSRDIEPDEQWKADLRKRIERDLRHMVDEAQAVRDAILNSRPPKSSRERARREYEDSMNNIRSLAQEQFISQLRLEMSERKWVLDLIASSDSPEVIRHQQWVLDNIHRPEEERTPFLPQDVPPDSEGGPNTSPQLQGDSEQGSYETFKEENESGGLDDRPNEPTGEVEGVEEVEEAADQVQKNWAQEEAIAEHQTAESSRVEAEITTSLEGEEAADAEATNPAIEDSACHTQEVERTAPEQVKPTKASLQMHRPNREIGSAGNGRRNFSTFSSYAASLSLSRPTSTSKSYSIKPSFLSSSISFLTTQRPPQANPMPDGPGTAPYAPQGIETSTRQAEGSVKMRDAASPEEADVSRKAVEDKKSETEAQIREAKLLAQEIEARREEARHLEERARQFLEEAKRLEASARQAEVSARLQEVEAQKKEPDATRKQAEAKKHDEGTLMQETKSQLKEEEVRHREDAVHRLEMPGEAPHKDEKMSKREKKVHFEKGEIQNHEESLRKFEKYIQGREADIEERLRIIDERSRVISLQEDDLRQRLAAVREHEGKLRLRETALREMETEKLRSHTNRKPGSNLPPQTSGVGFYAYSPR